VTEFPLPLPTARCAWFAAAAAAPVAAGAFVPALAWIGLVLLVVVLVATVVDWTAIPRAADFRVERVERPALSHGDDETLAVDVRLVVGGPTTARALDDLADGLDRVADPAPARVGVDGATRFSTRVHASRRGTADLSAFHLRCVGRFGLAERQIRFDLPARLRVYPGVRAVAQFARRLRRGRHEEAGVRRSRRRGEGTSFESLREYVRGEDPRFIDWKASAKHAKLIARRYEVERNQNVILMVDCGRWMTGEIGGMTRLDHALSSCVLLAKAAATRDDRVGLVAFANEVLAYVPPTKGRAAAEAILRATADVAPRLVESDYAGAFAHLAARHRKRSLVVLFTDVMSKDASRAVVDECVRGARRHLPLAATLRDVDLDVIAGGVPANAAATYRQAAAEELLLERENALAVMRRAGVQVVDVAPAALGPAVVERYLDVKARSLV
jgi:uncharacterized protein (DUF58 family)